MSRGDVMHELYEEARRLRSEVQILRERLFRERAENHRLAYEVLAECAVTIMGKNKMAFHKRARRRFLNIADRIERGAP